MLFHNQFYDIQNYTLLDAHKAEEQVNEWYCFNCFGLIAKYVLYLQHGLLIVLHALIDTLESSIDKLHAVTMITDHDNYEIYTDLSCGKFLLNDSSTFVSITTYHVISNCRQSNQTPSFDSFWFFTVHNRKSSESVENVILYICQKKKFKILKHFY